MDACETNLPGVVVLTPRRFGDARGFFAETWNRRVLAGFGIAADFVQDNHSVSLARGTLRGLHCQAPPRAQDKLVRCGRGAVFDVAVDARPGSPHFGLWTGVELSAANGQQIFIPKGFLHGFVTLTEEAEVIYKCSDYYDPACDRAVRWDDPDIGIAWPLTGQPVLSDKDRAAPALAEWDNPFAARGEAAGRVPA